MDSYGFSTLRCKETMLKLLGSPANYAWGSTTAIPELLGQTPDGSPVAEMWFGAHDARPSEIVDSGSSEEAYGVAVLPATLSQMVADHPVEVLGRESLETYGARLPFLLKLLAADKALSIQVHPDLEQAQEGFARENAAGIPIDDPARNYRDAWHKPELIYALSPFDALTGFREPHAIAATVDRFIAAEVPGTQPALLTWRDVLAGDDPLRESMKLLLDTPGYGAVADRLAAADIPQADRGDASLIGCDIDPVEILRMTNGDFPRDPGALVAIMLNMVRMMPGQALAMTAGIPHAYLRGLGVEIMAASDNVVRGGLTSKHIDIPELQRLVRFEVEKPCVQHPDDEGRLETGCRDFGMQVISHADGEEVGADGASIALCTSGAFTMRTAHGEQTLEPGEAYFIGDGEAPVTAYGRGTLFLGGLGS